jgi:mannose-6-phosphate isomerase-like protein (cupin superfamily)
LTVDYSLIEEGIVTRLIVILVAEAMLFATAARGDDMRRVVTGLDDRNHSVVLFDSRMPLESVAPGIVATNFWITDSYPPSLSKQDPAGRRIGTAPPDNGTKFRVVEFAPLDVATEAKMAPDMIMKGITNAPAKGVAVTHPLMHRTRSLDYAVILSGEIDMMLDDTSIRLKQGDVIVQQATNHAWINRGTHPCRILFVLMDSKEP